MHIGILAAAAHAAANNSPFTIFYNPRSALSFWLNIQDPLYMRSFLVNTSGCQNLMPKACLCRASPTEFVVPFAKYQKALYGNQISLGMRFRMMFETEELGTRRYTVGHFTFSTSSVLTSCFNKQTKNAY